MVCIGSACRVTFEDAVFKRCTLIVLSGAQATLTSPQFRHEASSTARLSLYAQGAGTKVDVQGGTITGGTQGVAVQAGATLTASHLTLTRVKTIGVEVQDEASSLKLHHCNMHAFCDRACGVRVHSGSSAELSHLSLSGMHQAVGIASKASASLADCTVADCAVAAVSYISAAAQGVKITGAATGRLDRCSLSGGLIVDGCGSHAHAAHCQFLSSGSSVGGSGAAALGGSALTAESCTSSGQVDSGYFVRGAGSVMELSHCSSDKDLFGCSAADGGWLKASNCVASSCGMAGFTVYPRGSAVLDTCSARCCNGAGARAMGEGARLVLEGCCLQDNGVWGAKAMDDAVVEVNGCSSSGHQHAGYWAEDRGHMTVKNSISDGDRKGCGVSGGGWLTMEGVTVDGGQQSGQLPKGILP